MRFTLTFVFILFAFIACKDNSKKATDSQSTVIDATTSLKQKYAEKVKAEFQHAWRGYKAHAWGHDALQPLTNSHRDWYHTSLLMTPVDAFDTMILMELEAEAAECKNLIFEKLKFDLDMDVQLFEVVIRVLGGLISAYQLDGDQRFLDLAVDLGDRLLPAFDTPTGMPYRIVNLKTGATRDHLNNPAEVGTLQLEFMMLSHLTGNKEYEEKALKAMDYLYDSRSEIGLVGTIINVKDGTWTNKESHISGMIDSYYEYLLKIGKLFDRPEYIAKYNTSIAAVNKYLLDEHKGRKWYGRCDMNSGKQTATIFGALDAFMPAMLALGGDLPLAEDVQSTCFYFWNMHGIEPEGYDYVKEEVLNGMYVLRPENIESAAYLYHHTGDTTYLNMGVKMFDSIVEHCRVQNGYTELADVTTMEKRNGMESFFLAETLKYAFLLFSDQEKLDFKNTIFNTEAHPFSVN